MSGYNEMLEKYRDVDEDEIMSGLTKDELARLENEIDREILEKPPDYGSCDSESYTTATNSSDDAESEEDTKRQIIEEETNETIVDDVQSERRPRSLSKSKPDAFLRGKLDKSQLKPVQKPLTRQKSKDKNTFKLPQLRKTVPSKSDRRMSDEDGNENLKNELIQAVKKREGKRRTKRVNSSGVSKRSYVASKGRRNSKLIARYRDGNENQVDGSGVNRNFVTEELMNLRPRLKKVNVQEPKLVLPDELHGVSFNRITAGARQKLEDEENEIEEVDQEQGISDDGDVSRNSTFGYDADIDVTPSDDSCLPGEDDCPHVRRKAMSESSETPSEGIAAMASTASTSAESCDMFAGELSINSTSVEETLERIRENDPLLVEVNLNNIHDVPMERFEELAEAMEDNTLVTSLHLANTGLTDRAAKALAKMLKKNNTLKKLNVESNFITGEGGRRLVSALRKNNSLTELSLNNQRHIFGAKAEQDMSKMLKENTSLLKLGYQFANPGLRMATSNILTKNMDLVRRKRVAEEKKRQQGGQSKRPQLRRQPSSEWYRKERLEKLKKLQERSKLLGLDPAKGIGKKDVEKVLQNMSSDEVSLLERWFTSKLLGMVDKPPTTCDQQINAGVAVEKPRKGSRHLGGDAKSDLPKLSENNLLNPSSRVKRSKSPVANRNDLLDSIRKSPIVLRKVKPGQIRSPRDIDNTDSEAELHIVKKDRCARPETERGQNRSRNIRTSKADENGSSVVSNSIQQEGREGKKLQQRVQSPCSSLNDTVTKSTPQQTKGDVTTKTSPSVPIQLPTEGSLISSDRLPTDAGTISRIESSSPEVKEWKEGEVYDSDEYEVVEIEVTDSEEESENENLPRSPSQISPGKITENEKSADHLRVSLENLKPSATPEDMSPVESDRVSAGKRSPSLMSIGKYHSGRSTTRSPGDVSTLSPPFSPRPTSQSPDMGFRCPSNSQHYTSSPQRFSPSQRYSRQSSRTSSKNSPVVNEKDVKPETLSTINSFFNFK